MTGGVFISYRREDSAGYAGRIFDRLTNRLGHDDVFFDVDTIPPGRDFVEVLSERVGECDALLAVIGRHWVDCVGSDERRRLDDPNDFVRIEVEAALKRDVPVIPVLVDGAAMPRADQLPDGLKALVRRQAVQISLDRFDSDVERLGAALAQIEDALSKAPGDGPRGRAQPARTLADAIAPPPSAAESGPAPSPSGASPPSPAAPAKLRGGRTALMLAAVVVVLAAGASVLFLTQRGSAPPTQPATTASFGHAAPAAKAIAAEASLPDAPPSSFSTRAPDPSSTVSASTAAVDANINADLWIGEGDFQKTVNEQIAAGYDPDAFSGQCKEGSLQYRTRWAKRPSDTKVKFSFGRSQDLFNGERTELETQGYRLSLGNTFNDCQGASRYNALWVQTDASHSSPAGKAVSEASPSAAGDWLSVPDFETLFKKQQLAGAYPDWAVAKCDDGVVRIRPHWAEIPARLNWEFARVFDQGFAAKKSEFSNRGLTLRYDNIFELCNGRIQHVSLWTKGE